MWARNNIGSKPTAVALRPSFHNNNVNPETNPDYSRQPRGREADLHQAAGLHGLEGWIQRKYVLAIPVTVVTLRERGTIGYLIMVSGLYHVYPQTCPRGFHGGGSLSPGLSSSADTRSLWRTFPPRSCWSPSACSARRRDRQQTSRLLSHPGVLSGQH